jgi:hypothetical protein
VPAGALVSLAAAALCVILWRAAPPT